MKLGIVGLPNVGKSTLFNAITDAGAQSANYPFCTIEPNIGVVAVPDKRLDKLAEMYDPDKYTPASIEFVDIAGLVKGASKGEGLGNKFLSNIRECDAIVHVVRCFENDDIIHVEGNINPARDIETINLELILSDVEMLERRIDKTKKMLKGDKKYQKDIDLFERVLDALNEGKPARSVECDDDEKAILSEVALLTNKPVIYAANMSDEDFSNGIDSNEGYKAVQKIAAEEHAGVLPICAQIEEEIVEMDKEEKEMFLADMGLEESGLDRLIKECYALLGLISYLTAAKQGAHYISCGDGHRHICLSFNRILRLHDAVHVIDAGDVDQRPAEHLERLSSVVCRNIKGQEGSYAFQDKKQAGEAEPENTALLFQQIAEQKHRWQLGNRRDGHRISHLTAATTFCHCNLIIEAVNQAM